LPIIVLKAGFEYKSKKSVPEVTYIHTPETKSMMFLPGGEKMRYGGELPHLSLILHISNKEKFRHI
jgi:hypothetical protein